MPSQFKVMTGATLLPAVNAYVAARIAEFGSIPQERQAELGQVAEYIQIRLAQAATARLVFICTHNSRRSHLAQLWARVAAEYYGLGGVETFSGGTEATALHPSAVAALQRAGLMVTTSDASSPNPRYRVKAANDAPAQECFSKVFDAPPNPTKDYCAIMTCSQADDACPVVTGCNLRVPIRYEDPKVADGTEREAALYDERSRQICREMFFMMSLV